MQLAVKTARVLLSDGIEVLGHIVFKETQEAGLVLP